MGGFHVVSSEEGEGLKLKNIFSGMLITDDSIVIGQVGWDDISTSKPLDKENLLRVNDGRFFVAKSFGDELVARVDSFGSDLIFLYRHRNQWAFSNSFFDLINYCKSSNWPVVLDHNVLASMFVSGSIGRQLLSSQTPVAQITLVPPGKYLSFNFDEGSIYEKELPKSLSKNIDYEEALAEWFYKWRSILLSLVISSEDKVSFDLSGGIDSRMLFGLAASSSVKDKIEFFSQPHKPQDLAVAKSLCEKFGCTLSYSPPNWKALPVDFQYEAYCRGNLGFYNLPVTPPLHYSSSNTLKFNGVGGENLRNFYKGTGAEWLRKLQQGLPSYLSNYESGVCDLFRRSCEEFEIDLEDKNGMIVHYRKLRSRIIGGRNTFENLKFNMVTPLTDSLLVDINDNSGIKNGLEIYRDIILAGGGEKLIAHPYDEQNKSFDTEFIKKSPFLGFLSSSGGNVVEKEYSVYPKNSVNSESVMGLAKDGKSGNLMDRISKEIISMESEMLFDKVPDPFKYLYNSSEWSSSESRKGAIEKITWHSLLKLCKAI